MNEETFSVGSGAFLAVDSPAGRYSAFFEEADETGYFYAVDLTRSERTILDAVHIYNVANVVDREKLFVAAIVWSADGHKCALLINDYPHAAFDFSSKRGFCRSNFPNFQEPINEGWSSADHGWSDEAVAWLGT